MVLAKK